MLWQRYLPRQWSGNKVVSVLGFSPRPAHTKSCSLSPVTSRLLPRTRLLFSPSTHHQLLRQILPVKRQLTSPNKFSLHAHGTGVKFTSSAQGNSSSQVTVGNTGDTIVRSFASIQMQLLTILTQYTVDVIVGGQGKFSFLIAACHD